MKNKIIFLTILCLTLSIVKSDSVCELDALVLELAQDLADDGKLDCLRIIPPPANGMENPKMTNLRLAAQWDTECSFESEYDWKSLLEIYGIPYLVDAQGKKVEHDFEDQADMCEIVRAAYFHRKFKVKNVDMNNIDPDFIDELDCYGFDNSPKICALAEGSFFEKSSWLIFLGPQITMITNNPYNPTLIKKPETAFKEDLLDSKTNYENSSIDILEKVLSLTPAQLIKEAASIEKVFDAKAAENPNKNKSKGCITIFQHCSFQGSNKQICSDTNLDSAMNDQLSSYKVDVGAHGCLFEHGNFKGKPYPFKSGQQNQCVATGNAETNFNDMASSIKFDVDLCLILHYHSRSRGSENENIFLCDFNMNSDFVIPDDVDFFRIYNFAEKRFSAVLYNGANETGDIWTINEKKVLNINEIPFRTIKSFRVDASDE